MFYSEYVLAKKGPLGKVWLAAHWTRKLTHAQIEKSDVVEACKLVMNPTAPLALRTSSHLLLGVVRIHDTKQKSLMEDCTEALAKVKLAFRPGTVDLPASSTTANINQISIPQTFTDFDRSFANFELELQQNTALHASRLEDITLVEDQFAGGPSLDFFTTSLTNDNVPFFEPEADLPPALPSSSTSRKSRDRDRESAVSNTADRSMELMRDADISVSVSEPSFHHDFTSTSIDLPAEKEVRPMLEEEPIERPHAEIPEYDMYADTGFGDFPALNELEVQSPQPVDIEIHTPQMQISTPVVRQPPIARKRKLVVDNETVLSSDVIRHNLSDEGVRSLARRDAPPMHGAFRFLPGPLNSQAAKRRLLEEENIDQFFLRPCLHGFGGEALKLFTVHLTNIGSGHHFSSRSADRPASPENLRHAETSNIDDPGISFYDDTGFPYYPEDAPVQQIEAEQLEERNKDLPALDVSHDQSTSIPPLDDNLSFNLDDSKEVTSGEYAQAAWTKRTQPLLDSLKTTFSSQKSLEFEGLISGTKSRRGAVRAFFEVLVIKTKGFIDVEQKKPFGPIKITPTTLLVES